MIEPGTSTRGSRAFDSYADALRLMTAHGHPTGIQLHECDDWMVDQMGGRYLVSWATPTPPRWETFVVPGGRGRPSRPRSPRWTGCYVGASPDPAAFELLKVKRTTP